MIPRSREEPRGSEGLLQLVGANSSNRRLAFVAFVAIETVALVSFMWLGRGLWFFSDEWDFLASRTGGDIGGLLEPHGNVHPSALPALAFRLLWAAVGLGSYRPYLLLIVVAHLMCAWLVRVVMRRAGVRPWTATAAAAVLVFFGTGYQNIVWAFQIGFVGSIMFGLIHLLLADHDEGFDRRDWLGLLAGLAGLLCSAVSVTMVFAVGVAVLIRRGWRVALVHFLAVEIAYFLWWNEYARGKYSTTPIGVRDEIRFVADLIANAFDAMGQFRGVGVCLGLVLVVGLTVAWRTLGRSQFLASAAAPLALVAAAFAFAANTASGRGTTPGGSARSHYLYVVVALVLPALGVAADALIQQWRVLTPVVISLLIVGIPGNVQALRDYTQHQVVPHRQFRRMLLSLPRHPSAKQAGRSWIAQTGPQGYYITVGWLLDGVASGKVPAPTSPTPMDIETNRLRLSLTWAFPFPPDAPECVQLREPAANDNRGVGLELSAREGIIVRGAVVRIVPEPEPRGSTYPLQYDARTRVRLMARTGPIAFRVVAMAIDRAGASLCAPAHAFLEQPPP